jgi:hypothetical protein
MADEKFDITKYPDALKEIARHIDFMPGATDQEKEDLVMEFVFTVVYEDE